MKGVEDVNVKTLDTLDASASSTPLITSASTRRFTSDRVFATYIIDGAEATRTACPIARSLF